MKRQIKFRAWNGRAKQMAQYVTAIQMGDTQGTPSSVNVIVNGHNETWEVEHDKVELLQYTGLKGKNGKPIYEGDIIESGLKYPQVFVVEWSKEDAAFMAGSQRIFYVAKRGKILGNVHDNPDLLEAD